MAKFAKATSWWRCFVGLINEDGFHRLRVEMPSLDLAAFDLRVRQLGVFSNDINRQWHSLKAADLKSASWTPQGTSFLGFASFHYNGFVRQAAVEHLAERRDGSELPFLLIRLNDWVEPVRAKAGEAVRNRLHPSYAEHFLNNIGLVLRVSGLPRVGQQMGEDVKELLKSAECRPVLRKGREADDRLVRLMSFQLEWKVQPEDRFALISAAVKDSDGTIRSWASRVILPDLTSEQTAVVAGKLANDPLMSVRRDLVWFLANQHPRLAGPFIKAALMDRHRSVREVAVRFAQLAGIVDVRAFYLQVLKDENPSHCAIAVRELGRLGNATDKPVVMPFTCTPVVRIRGAATYAMGRLGDETDHGILIKLLADKSPRVSLEAYKALLPKVNQVHMPELERLLANGYERHVRTNVLKLINNYGKWQRLPVLLAMSADADEVVRQISLQTIRAWFYNYNRSFAEPTQSDLKRIKDAMSTAASTLTRGQARELDACLRLYSK